MSKKMNAEKLFLVGCILLIAVAFSITVSAEASVAKPIGADFYYHLNIATLISKGDIVGAWTYSIQNILFPYGFMLFHFGLSGIVLSGNQFLWARVLETVLMPTTFALTMFLMVKKANAKAAFITGLCLLGSLALVDGALQLRPESLDLLLYPLMMFTVLSTKKKTFIGLAIVTVYSHSIAALSNIYGFSLKLFKENKYNWRKTILVGVAAIVPVLAVSIYYIQGAFKMWFTLAGANNSNPQQTLFWVQPLAFIPFYSGLTLLGFMFLFKRRKSDFESLLSWGLVWSMIMIPFWADRWLQYAAIPLSCLVGLGLKDASANKLLVVLPILFMFTAFYVMYWLFISFSGQWWQP
jgi:hypothetical protein